MLALARGEGQSIIIDGYIEVKVVKWSRSSVRLAIQAPREVTVDRDEIWRKMHPGELTPLEKAEAERKERFEREGSPAPVAAPGAGAAAMNGGAVGEANRDGATVTASVAGVFYGSSRPGGNPYVSAGSAVEQSTLVGAIKHGQQLHDVRAGIKGTVVRVVAASGQHVETGDVLLLIKAEG